MAPRIRTDSAQTGRLVPAGNFIGVALGRRGSGKSVLLRRQADRFPRTIVLDALGEHMGDPGATVVTSLSAALAALGRLAAEPSYRLVVCLSPEAWPVLLRWLLPAGEGLGVGYGAAVGGICVVCGEADLLAPNNLGCAPSVQAALHRGRHYRVSLLLASRRPADLHRMVTAQADALWLFRFQEKRDLRYIGDLIGERRAALVPRLGDYAYLEYLPDRDTLSRCEADGSVHPLTASEDWAYA